MQRRHFLALVAAASLSTAALPAIAQSATDYPTKEIHIVVPFPAGGATDLAARLIAEKMGADWGQPVIVDNVAGATGAIGTTQVARAEPDGYTLLMGTGTTNTLLPHVTNGLKFDPLEDFDGISLITVFPNILVVRPDLPAQNIQELVQLLKDNPGKHTFSSSGYGSSIHLAGELFKQETGAEMTHVPFTGSAPALTALLGGHVDMMFDNLPTVLPHVQEGKLRALGVTSLERVPSAPDIPTIAESIPGFEITAWAGLVAPAGTPEPIKEKLSEKVREILSDPAVIERMEAVGAFPRTSTPAELDEFARAGYEKWGRVVKEAGITPK